MIHILTDASNPDGSIVYRTNLDMPNAAGMNDIAISKIAGISIELTREYISAEIEIQGAANHILVAIDPTNVLIDGRKTTFDVLHGIYNMHMFYMVLHHCTLAGNPIARKAFVDYIQISNCQTKADFRLPLPEKNHAQSE